MRLISGSCGTVGSLARRRQRGAVSARKALVLLAFLFVAPVLAAWLLHLGAEHGWWTGGTTNRGTLIEPPRALDLPAGLVDPSGTAFAPDFLRGKWTLLYVGGGACAEDCRQSLFTLRQVRLAQGENIRRVQRLFLAAGVSAADLQPTLAEYPDLAVAIVPREQAETIAALLRIDGSDPQDAGRLYVVDPLGNLMMYYRPGTDPRDIIQDLQRLLKYSHVG